MTYMISGVNGTNETALLAHIFQGYNTNARPVADLVNSILVGVEFEMLAFGGLV